jgi:hypothetical protein
MSVPVLKRVLFALFTSLYQLYAFFSAELKCFDEYGPRICRDRMSASLELFIKDKQFYYYRIKIELLIFTKETTKSVHLHSSSSYESIKKKLASPMREYQCVVLIIRGHDFMWQP